MMWCRSGKGFTRWSTLFLRRWDHDDQPKLFPIDLIFVKVSTANSGHLSGAERRKNNLILTLLLGKRDLLQSFLSIYVHSINDLNWEKLLKYVWSLETGTVQVICKKKPSQFCCDLENTVFPQIEQCFSIIDYGYEFMGVDRIGIENPESEKVTKYRFE